LYDRDKKIERTTMPDILNSSKNFPLLLFLVLGKAAIMILTILYSPIGLGPDEAQYWTWSQDLSWGYYSKPPGIAWQIWLGTHLLGNTELGVRCMSVVLAALYPLLIYSLARACRLKPRTCFWAGLVMALTPLGIAGSFFAITDGGMMLFWILACLVIAYSLNRGQRPSYWLLGLIVGLGALFKWPIYILWLGILCFFPLYPLLIHRHFLIGLAISLLGLFPSLVWNAQHDWVTFRHVFSTLYVPQVPLQAKSTFFNGNFWEFLGAQSALLSPIVFILLLLSLYRLYIERNTLPSALCFCGLLCFSLLSLFLTLSIFKKLQGNWGDFAFPSGIVCLCWFCCERAQKMLFWLKGGLVLSILLCLLAFLLPILQSSLPFNTPYKINPFKHNLGWSTLRQELATLNVDPAQEFLFSDKYQMSSLLSFYNPAQQRAYFLNLQGARKNQFSFWPSMKEEQLGKTGYFIVTENHPHLDQLDDLQIQHYCHLLAKYFQTVEFKEKKILFSLGHQKVKEAALFKCINYQGLTPADPELY
jgi:4-amino-4-deoxy-L-arabinose transferase-like glycosyltransferase